MFYITSLHRVYGSTKQSEMCKMKSKKYIVKIRGTLLNCKPNLCKSSPDDVGNYP